jgi:hypothetical protein
MFAPRIDALCVGGLSIAVVAGLFVRLAFGAVPFDQAVPPLLPYALTAGITWPHFLASYRLLYASRDSIVTYRRASIFFPLALAIYCVFAVVRSPSDPVHVHLLSLTAGVYLARHYTGQTWGMMASFSHVAGVPFEPGERRLCQWGLDLMMVWHMVWALGRGIGSVAPVLAPFVHRVDAHVDLLALPAFGLGLTGLGAMSRRIDALVPSRVLLPWLALFGWYALLRRDPTSFVVVQSAHALQYLIFPLRIEQTRRTGLAPVEPRRALLWMAGLVAVSLAVFAGVPQLFRLSFARSGGTADLFASVLSAFVSFVNIHHYFIDGSLYKLRNPAVRRDLFAHLQPTARTGAA